MLTLLRRNPGFRWLVGANQVSVVGDYLLNVGLAFFVYDLTGSTLASGGTLLAGFLPSILVGSVAGVFVDRWDRRRTMIVSQVLMALALLPLLLVDRPEDVWIVYVVIAAEGVLEQFWFPAEQALIPHLVPDEDLLAANAVNGQVSQVGRLVGAGLGGVVMGFGGLAALAAVDALTFVVSLLLVARIPPVEADTTVRPVPTPMLTEWAEGLRFAFSRKPLVVAFVYCALAMCGEGFMGTLFAPFVRDVLEGDAEAYGLVVGVQAVGGIAGGFVAVALAKRYAAALLFGVGAVVFGLIDLAMFLYPLLYVALWPAVACMVVVGIPGAVVMAGFSTMLQRGSEDAYRGRVMGALGVVQGVSIVTGTLVAGVLGEAIGIIPVLSMQGVFAVLSGVVVLVVLRDELGQRPVRPETPAAAPTPSP